VGGFSGKAVALAEGMLYANDPGRYQRELEEYASATPAQVKAALQRWLTRPVYSIRVDPGEREAYQEAAGPARTTAQAPAPAASAVTEKPRGPLPPVGTVAKLDFPDIQRATLSNGVTVTYVRRPEVPAMRVALEFDAGTAADPAGRLGTQNLMLNLLTEGTKTRNSLQIAEEEERLGASISTGASLDRTVVNLSALTPNLAPSLDLMADIVMNPAFAPSEVERIRAQQLASIASEQTQPAGLARRVLPGLLYGENHPYGRPFSGLGDAAAVKAVTGEELSRFHQGWIRPDKARIYAVGDLPLAQLVPMLEARFGRWRAPAAPRGTKAFGAAPNPGGTRIVLIDRPQSPQSYILAGAVLPMRGSDDLVPITAANEVLSGDFLARINQDIRETKGWSYGAFGSVQPVENYLPLIVQAPVQTNQTGPSVRAIIDQVRSFTADKGITPAELQRVVAGNTRQLAGSFENSAQLLNALRSMALLKRPDNFYETVGARFQGMTTATLNDAARKAIDPSKLVFVVVGDASVVRPQLDALGLPVEVMPMR
jgi:predicted Zn-dependent peptidase